METLDHRSPVPLYHQLADILLARILSGAYPIGARIPSEPELSQSFGIGRPTVRQATELLVRKRRLERRRGAGTFVVEPPPQVDLLSLAGTMASFAKQGIEVAATIVQCPLKITVTEVDPEHPFAQRRAYFLSRLSSVDNTPVLLEELYFDCELFAGLEHIEVAGRSLSRLVQEHYQLRPSSATQNFRVFPVDSKRAAFLAAEPGQPILLVKRYLHFSRQRSAIYAELYCRTEQMVFSQTLEGVEHG